MKHLCCLRHLLVSLGRKTFSSQVANLVTVPTEEEYRILKRDYESSWANIQDPVNKSKITRMLKKIGHKYQDGLIQIFDMQRWEQVSMQYRPKYRMPSCSNQIESMHGHLNAITPKNNKFWNSLARIIDEIIKKKNRFEENFKHNYRCYKNKIKSIVKVTPKDVMESMINQYKPDLENNECKCGQADLFSSMINTKL